jgi:hypothetical protein
MAEAYSTRADAKEARTLDEALASVDKAIEIKADSRQDARSACQPVALLGREDDARAADAIGYGAGI